MPLEATRRHRPVEAQGGADAREREGGERGLVLALVPLRQVWAPCPPGAGVWGGVYARWLPASSSQTRSDGPTRVAILLQVRRTAPGCLFALSVVFPRRQT